MIDLHKYFLRKYVKVKLSNFRLQRCLRISDSHQAVLFGPRLLFDFIQLLFILIRLKYLHFRTAYILYYHAGLCLHSVLIINKTQPTNINFFKFVNNRYL